MKAWYRRQKQIAVYRDRRQETGDMRHLAGTGRRQEAGIKRQ